MAKASGGGTVITFGFLGSYAIHSAILPSERADAPMQIGTSGHISGGTSAAEMSYGPPDRGLRAITPLILTLFFDDSLSFPSLSTAPLPITLTFPSGKPQLAGRGYIVGIDWPPVALNMPLLFRVAVQLAQPWVRSEQLLAEDGQAITAEDGSTVVVSA